MVLQHIEIRRSHSKYQINAQPMACMWKIVKDQTWDFAKKKIRRETWDKPEHTVSIVLKKNPRSASCPGWNDWQWAESETNWAGPSIPYIRPKQTLLLVVARMAAWPLQLRRRPAPPLPLAPLSSTDHQRRPVPARVLASPNPPPQWRASPEVLKRSSHLCRPCWRTSMRMRTGAGTGSFSPDAFASPAPPSPPSTPSPALVRCQIRRRGWSPPEAMHYIFCVEPKPIDIAAEERDGQRGPHGGGAAQAACGTHPRRGPPTPGAVHALQRVATPPHRPARRTRRAPHEGLPTPISKKSCVLNYFFCSWLNAYILIYYCAPCAKIHLLERNSD